MHCYLSLVLVLISWYSFIVNGHESPNLADSYPWPLPQSIIPQLTYFTLSKNFRFELKETKHCEILDDALERYHKLVFLKNCQMLDENEVNYVPKGEAEIFKDENYGGQLFNLTIQMRSKCESMPHPNMDEMYTLRINTPDFPNKAFLFANHVWGILRGLETFSQLIIEHNGNFYINGTFIVDNPRFAHRGLLLDTSRHFLPVHILLNNLDAMTYNKLNVFHWHIVDDPSFPYESRTFPNLSKYGAYRYTHVYSQEDVAKVINYARKRGIRVMVEFDTPGHTLSWGKGIKNLLTQCYKNGTKINAFGPIDPSNEQNYKVLELLFKEISQVFPEQYLHLGGDEVDFSCWESNPIIRDFMKNMSFGKDFAKLEQYYIQKVVDIVKKLKKSTVVWQEVFDNGVELQQDAIVHVWKGDTEKEYEEEMSKVTEKGFRAILSTPWYLNYIKFGADWKDYYRKDPLSFNGTSEQKNLVVGGEICMWGEFADGNNVISTTWPRSSPVAERLWSSKKVNNVEKAMPRLERQRCLMLKRGIRGQPVNGPGFCRCDYANEEGATGGWSWSSLLQNAKQKVISQSSETLEFMKRDLTEFKETVQKDTVSVVSSTADYFRKAMNALSIEEDESSHSSEEHTTTETVSECESKVSDSNSEALKSPISLQMIEETAKNFMSSVYEILTGKSYSNEDEEVCIVVGNKMITLPAERWQTLVAAVQNDPETYSQQHQGSPEEYEAWLSTFKFNDHEEEIQRLLSDIPAISKHYSELVPHSITHNEFWHRYFYRIHQLATLELIRKEKLNVKVEEGPESEEIKKSDEKPNQARKDENEGSKGSTKELADTVVAKQKSGESASSSPSDGTKASESSEDWEKTELSEIVDEAAKKLNEKLKTYAEKPASSEEYDGDWEWHD
ncbi:beta-hexosaminidase subunit alpha-like protein [Dinothrombium tinctorium]|uniref:beta-N-acetylhexosaminidase n=1 Tax=Dinothrombium tinctorium TaxID=1965070 RepID=A0A3S3NMV7_9ACAR|nr:beta-hexosaminidase subunit alpha-like protein [Dinothrombium tinctorium]RWS05772.1 beta-hexosaminidase subunit alpha-like protein [Dinothrombium tinctorium]